MPTGELHRLLAGLLALDLMSLLCAVAVRRAAGFRSAALLLGIDQSTLSRRVRRLEAAAAVRLFSRSSGGTRTTREGEAFLDKVEDALARIGEAASDRSRS